MQTLELATRLSPAAGCSYNPPNKSFETEQTDQASTAAIATAVASTFFVFSPATHIRPERTR